MRVDLAAADRRALVSATVLTDAVATILEACDVLAGDARLAADCLVEADLRGVESHGVSNLLAVYVQGIRDRHINPRPDVRVVRERPGSATLDGDGGLGGVVAVGAMDLAIDKAREVGVGVVVVNNSRHLGMAAYHAMRALDHGMIGVCSTACGPRVLPTFGAEPRLGTNPIAVAAPAGRRDAFVFDAATTTVAMNKIRLAQRDGTTLPGGVIADARGIPIMTPTEVPDGFQMLHLGATYDLGSHKGYGLAAAVDILGTVLSGSRLLGEVGTGFNNHTLIAMDIEAFTDLAGFEASMDRYLDWLNECAPAPGEERVLYAGQPEAEIRTVRSVEGIPVRLEVLDELEALGREVGAEVELTMSAGA